MQCSVRPPQNQRPQPRQLLRMIPVPPPSSLRTIPRRPPLSAVLEAVFWCGLLLLAILARASSGPGPRVVKADTGAELTSVESWSRLIQMVGAPARAWYDRTPPLERVSWGGLIACATLGLVTLGTRVGLVRRSRVVPAAFRTRFQSRWVEGKFDLAQALDFCELNPSPAARVAMAAIRRYGRPGSELERTVATAVRQEIEPIRRHVGTLRRVAALAPLIGLFGSLAQAGRILAQLQPNVPMGPPLAEALVPLTFGVGLAILALLAYDGLVSRIESLAAELDRIGVETVEALAVPDRASVGRTWGTTSRSESPAPVGVRLGHAELLRRPGTPAGDSRS